MEVELNGETVVDLPLDATYTKLPQHVYIDAPCAPPTRPLALPALPLRELCARVLRLLSVGSKRFFVEKFDRSLSGLVAQQPVSPRERSL